MTCIHHVQPLPVVLAQISDRMIMHEVAMRCQLSAQPNMNLHLSLQITDKPSEHNRNPLLPSRTCEQCQHNGFPARLPPIRYLQGVQATFRQL
jgi:type II secretory ATPase GspE/PulE/Tfp pilus assembly ATPase PilB-like protein